MAEAETEREIQERAGIYVCPNHPEIEQWTPGRRPECGAEQVLTRGPR